MFRGGLTVTRQNMFRGGLTVTRQNMLVCWGLYIPMLVGAGDDGGAKGMLRDQGCDA